MIPSPPPEIGRVQFRLKPGVLTTLIKSIPNETKFKQLTGSLYKCQDDWEDKLLHGPLYEIGLEVFVIAPLIGVCATVRTCFYVHRTKVIRHC